MLYLEQYDQAFLLDQSWILPPLTLFQLQVFLSFLGWDNQVLFVWSSAGTDLHMPSVTQPVYFGIILPMMSLFCQVALVLDLLKTWFHLFFVHLPHPQQFLSDKKNVTIFSTVLFCFLSNCATLSSNSWSDPVCWPSLILLLLCKARPGLQSCVSSAQGSFLLIPINFLNAFTYVHPSKVFLTHGMTLLEGHQSPSSLSTFSITP